MALTPATRAGVPPATGSSMGPCGAAGSAWCSPRFCPRARPTVGRGRSAPRGLLWAGGLSALVGLGEFGLWEFSGGFTLHLVSVQTGLKPKHFLNFLQIGSSSRPAAPAGPLLPHLPARAVRRNVLPQAPRAACPSCCSPGLPGVGPQQPPPQGALAHQSLHRTLCSGSLGGFSIPIPAKAAIK